MRVDAGAEDERQRLTALKPPDTLQVLGPSDLPAFLRRRFQEKNGTVGTVFYVRFKNELTFSDGHNLLRMAATTDSTSACVACDRRAKRMMTSVRR